MVSSSCAEVPRSCGSCSTGLFSCSLDAELVRRESHLLLLFPHSQSLPPRRPHHPKFSHSSLFSLFVLSSISPIEVGHLDESLEFTNLPATRLRIHRHSRSYLHTTIIYTPFDPLRPDHRQSELQRPRCYCLLRLSRVHQQSQRLSARSRRKVSSRRC